jgi:hypothetical protein
VSTAEVVQATSSSALALCDRGRERVLVFADDLIRLQKFAARSYRSRREGMKCVLSDSL